MGQGTGGAHFGPIIRTWAAGSPLRFYYSKMGSREPTSVLVFEHGQGMGVPLLSYCSKPVERRAPVRAGKFPYPYRELWVSLAAMIG